MANVKKTAPRLRKLSVYLYIPNIIGGFLWVFLIVYDYWLHGFDGIFHFYVVNVRVCESALELHCLLFMFL